MVVNTRIFEWELILLLEVKISRMGMWCDRDELWVLWVGWKEVVNKEKGLSLDNYKYTNLSTYRFLKPSYDLEG